MKITELFPDVITEGLKFECKEVLQPENPVRWAKTIIRFANSDGGILFIGVANDGEVFGMDLDEFYKTKNLITLVNDRHIFPHAKLRYMMRSVDANAERFVLAVNVVPSDSILRYREGDFNETVYIKGDGNATPATPEDIISLSKRKYGVDNETTEISYFEEHWSQYIELCKEFREEGTIPSIKELQNEEILSKDGYAKPGFVMFMDDYADEDSLICCRLWPGHNKVGATLDSARFKGSLAKVFLETIAFVERNTKTGWEKTENGGRRSLRSYPKEAIREALVNAIAHRDYSIAGTQIDVDIYCDRIDIVSPGSWLLSKDYYDYPYGTIPSVRRNTIIAAAFDVANLMERGGTGFQNMMESYKGSSDELQPMVIINPGFLDLRLFDRLYKKDASDADEQSDQNRVIEILQDEGPMGIRELQHLLGRKSRSTFLRDVINPLLESNAVYRDGKPKSPKSRIRINKDSSSE